METPDSNKDAKKEYQRPLTIFEAINSVKGSVPIEDEDSSKEDKNGQNKGERHSSLFPVNNLLF